MTPKNYTELYDAVKNKQIVEAVRKDGKKDRLFIATNFYLCAFLPRSSRKGYRVSELDFDNYVKFISPKAEPTEEEKLKKQYSEIAKYKRLASEASFTNDFIESCKAIPDFETWKNDKVKSSFNDNDEPRPKSLYALGITTGNKIDGKVISLSRIAKEHPHVIQHLRNAIKTQTKGHHGYGRFAGYDMTITTEIKENGQFYGYLALEYKGCGNGYYYILINDENFIGCDVD
jgi:hypothetical protein